MKASDSGVPVDTNVVIHLRDGDPMVTQEAAALDGAVLISMSHESSWRAAFIASWHRRLFAGPGSTSC